MSRSVVEVVSGVIANEHGHIFMGKRKAELRGNLWELPGGKIENGETPQQALYREWREELDLHVVPGEYITTDVLRLDVTIVVHLYGATIDPVQHPMACGFAKHYEVATEIHLPFKLNAHTKVRWIDPRFAMKHLPCSPGYYLHYRPMLQWLAAQGHRYAP